MGAEVPGGDVVWDGIWTARVSLGRQKPWASALGQDCSTGLELRPGIFRKFINFLREPGPSFELLAEDKRVFYCVCGFVFFFFNLPQDYMELYS